MMCYILGWEDEMMVKDEGGGGGSASAVDVSGKESKVLGRWIMQVWWEVNWGEA